jgi:hypothetical protein
MTHDLTLEIRPMSPHRPIIGDEQTIPVDRWAFDEGMRSDEVMILGTPLAARAIPAFTIIAVRAGTDLRVTGATGNTALIITDDFVPPALKDFSVISEYGQIAGLSEPGVATSFTLAGVDEDVILP